MATQLVKDPVCGMMIDPASAAGMSEYRGETYYFCAEGCKQAFDMNPEQYLDLSHVPAGTPPARKRWWEFWK